MKHHPKKKKTAALLHKMNAIYGAKKNGAKKKEKEKTLPLSHIRSRSKLGLTATVVVAERWSGSRVMLMLSLIGRINASSRLPQYLITAMLVGDLAVAISNHCPCSAAISRNPSSEIGDRRSWGRRRLDRREFRRDSKFSRFG